MRARDRLLLALVALAIAGCGGGGAGDSDELTVFAAASLTEAFTEIGESFEAAHPGTDVTLAFASSSDLVNQLTEGAPADVFASADPATMETLVAAGGASGAPEIFATNRLAIIVAPGNPEGITGLADLADPGLVVVGCAPDVPIGRYTQEVFERAGVTVTPKSLEENVKAVVSKVTLGEADAGVVYATDVRAAGDKASGVPIPDDLNVVATYPIVVTRQATDPEAAASFVAFVRSPDGRAVLERFGFGT